MFDTHAILDSPATRPIIRPTMADKPRVVMDPSATYRRLVPVDRLASPVTPSDDVYVIAHMGIARVDVAQWRLAPGRPRRRPLRVDYHTPPRPPPPGGPAALRGVRKPRGAGGATRRGGDVVP